MPASVPSEQEQDDISQHVTTIIRRSEISSQGSNEDPPGITCHLREQTVARLSPPGTNYSEHIIERQEESTEEFDVEQACGRAYDGEVSSGGTAKPLGASATFAAQPL